jgi:hypothetical protein
VSALISRVRVAPTSAALVMAGLVPAIHVLLTERGKKDVDVRDKRGHDELDNLRLSKT